MKTALILAAGLGRRFGILTESMPKGFLKICGKSLIEMSVTNLIKRGYENIIIVTGHKHNYYEEFAKKYTEISTIHNTDYVNSGSAKSLILGINQIQDECTILESDLLYDPKILDLISYGKDSIITSYLTQSGDEVYVESTNNYMSNLSKNTTELDNHTHEFIGITNLSRHTVMNVLIPFVNKLFNQNKNLDYKSLLVQSTKKYGIQFKLTKTHCIWCEINNIRHYYKAVNRVFPLIYNIL